jgi:uncharacterized membrane protein
MVRPRSSPSHSVSHSGSAGPSSSGPGSSPLVRGLLFWSSPAMLLGAGAWLVAHFEELPARWPVHFGFDGTPDGWVTKSWPAALFPVALGFVIWALCEASLAFGSRAGAPLSDHGRRASTSMARWVVAATSVLSSALALRLPFASRGLGTWFWVPLGLVLASSLAASLHLRARVLRARVEQPRAFEGYSLFSYANASDPRLWVPKLSGLGWTLNFARPEAKWVMFALLAVPALLAVLPLLSAR